MALLPASPPPLVVLHWLAFLSSALRRLAVEWPLLALQGLVPRPLVYPYRAPLLALALLAMSCHHLVALHRHVSLPLASLSLALQRPLWPLRLLTPLYHP